MISSTERPQPYIGISGVVGPEQQVQLIDIAHGAGIYDAGRSILLGVKAVHKTQFLDIENKYGSAWYPVGERQFTESLVAGSPNTLAVAQAYLDIDHVADADYRHAFTQRIVTRGWPWIQGIQYDMLPWHTDDAMFSYLENTKAAHGVAILLQCHKQAMADLGPRGVAKRLGQLVGVVDYVLYDASHGTGQRLSTAQLRPFIDEAYSSKAMESMGIAVAGGLDEKTVQEDLPELVTEFTDLSWDAEGRLHPENAEGKRPLDMNIVRGYLGASAVLARLAWR